MARFGRGLSAQHFFKAGKFLLPGEGFDVPSQRQLLFAFDPATLDITR